MPLSEYEQRVLEQLERDLGTDPKLSHALTRAPRSRGRLTWAVLGVLVGLGVVVVGVMIPLPIVGIAGFALMITAALWVLLDPRTVETTADAAAGASDQPSSKAGVGVKDEDQGFMRRVEERFERRREQGDL